MDQTTAQRRRNSKEPRIGPPDGFEELYRRQYGVVTAFFARRSRDPETVADLTAETFLEALRSYASFDVAKGSGRAWLLAIARRVFARFCEQATRQQSAARLDANRRVLDDDAIDELASRIDAERPGRDLLEHLARASPVEREAVELVDIAGLTPKEAASALGISPGTLRVRLSRARARLRGKEQILDV
jgi:RNA polymerase sigma-70 factor (ECF subfamily)